MKSNIAYVESLERLEARKSHAQDNQNLKIKEKRTTEISPIFMVFGLGIAALSLLLGFLPIHNKLATKGYLLTKLEAENQELIMQRQQIDLYVSKVKSMTGMIEEGRMDKMRKPLDILSINMPDMKVASK